MCNGGKLKIFKDAYVIHPYNLLVIIMLYFLLLSTLLKTILCQQQVSILPLVSSEFLSQWSVRPGLSSQKEKRSDQCPFHEKSILFYVTLSFDTPNSLLSLIKVI